MVVIMMILHFLYGNIQMRKYSNTQTLCGGLCQTAFIAQFTIVLMQQVEFRCPQSRMSDQTITPETSCPTLYE